MDLLEEVGPREAAEPDAAGPLGDAGDERRLAGLAAGAVEALILLT
jgi:hypothetical protein